jgi:hypothetical protein
MGRLFAGKKKPLQGWSGKRVSLTKNYLGASTFKYCGDTTPEN